MLNLKNRQKATRLFHVFFFLEVLLIVVVAVKGDYRSFGEQWLWLSLLGLLLVIFYILYLKLKTDWLEQQLLEEKIRSQSLISALPNPVLVPDGTGRVVILNQAACRLFKQEASQILHEDIAMVLGANLGERIKGGFLGTLPFNEIYDLELIPIQADTGTHAGRLLLFHSRGKTRIDDAEILTTLRDAAMECITGVYQKQDVAHPGFSCYHFWKLTGWARHAIFLAGEAPVLPSDGPHAIEDIVKAVQNKLAPVWESLHIKLDNQLDCVKARVQGNRRELEWIFIELLLNAIAGVEDCTNPVISLSSELEPDWIVINICDNGCAIREDRIKHLAKACYHGNAEGRAGKAGVGLGLFAVQKLLEQIDGNIWMESKQGKGTKASVLLPVIK